MGKKKKQEPKKSPDNQGPVTQANIGTYLNFGGTPNLRTEGNALYVTKIYSRTRTFLGKDSDPAQEAKLREEAEKQKVTQAKADAKLKAESDAKEQAQKKEKE